jgi:hypothetical protein
MLNHILINIPVDNKVSSYFLYCISNRDYDFCDSLLTLQLYRVYITPLAVYKRHGNIFWMHQIIFVECTVGLPDVDAIIL